MKAGEVSGEVSVSPASIVVPASEGTVLEAFGDSLQVKLSGGQTQGSLAVVLYTVSPGGGPPPHVHFQEDELFLIIEGRLRFLTNDEWTESFGAGTVVYMPRGSVHSFQNVADTPGRFWIITKPSGFEQFFARCAAVFAHSGPPDIARLVTISAEHDIEYMPALVSAAPAPV